MALKKGKTVRWLQTWLINPLEMSRAEDAGSRCAVLETIGRKSGTARRTPAGNSSFRG